MLRKKIFIVFISLISISIFSCGDNSNAIKEANDEVIKDTETLSTDLITNPASLEADSSDLTNVGKLVFSDTIHDFGSLKEGEIIQYEFEYTNVGKREVIITEAKGSCGCTVAEYDTKPIPPGAKGSMKVTFNSEGKPGFNEKNVQITTNANPPRYRLIILAKVDK